MKKNHSLKACESPMQQYFDKGGECVTVEEGCLGPGTAVCFAEGYKAAIIHGYHINPWTSGHTVRMYSEMPKKYAAMVEESGF